MQKYFKTRDFYLSAYLFINSCRLINCTSEGGLSTFEFEESEGLTGHVAAFYSLKGYCDALTYDGVVRNLKSIIHAARTLTSNSEVLNNGTNNKHGENN